MAIRAVVPVAATNVKMDIFTWAALTQATLDVGAGVDVQDAKSLLAVIDSGTLGAGGNIKWQGSRDNVNWFTMTSEIGAPAAANQVAALTPTMLKERPKFVRPICDAGDGTTTLNVSLTVGR